MSSVPNWQVCGFGFKGWNDAYPVKEGVSAFVFYTKAAMIGITLLGEIFLFNAGDSEWTKLK